MLVALLQETVCWVTLLTWELDRAQNWIDRLTNLYNLRLFHDFAFDNYEALIHVMGRSLFLNRFFWASDDYYVAPNFMTKPDTVTSLHSEECWVLAFLSRSNEFQTPDVVLARLNLVGDLQWFDLHVIATSLDKIQILWPSVLTIVSDGPFLGEAFTRKYLVLVSEAFLDKATLISNLLLILLVFCSKFLSLSQANLLNLTTELADEPIGCVSRLPNFEHWMFIMSSISLTNRT